MSYFEKAVNYLPHDNPMVLIDHVLEVTEEIAICQVKVEQTGILFPFLNEQNELPAWFAVEMMAQTIGVWNGWHSKKVNVNIKLGLLLGVRGLKTIVTTYPLNALLQIHVKLLLQDARLANFDCQLTMNGQVVTEAKLNVYQPDEVEISYFMNKVQ